MVNSVGKKEKLLITSNFFFFPHSVFKTLVLQTHKTRACLGKGYSKIPHVLTTLGLKRNKPLDIMNEKESMRYIYCFSSLQRNDTFYVLVMTYHHHRHHYRRRQDHHRHHHIRNSRLSHYYHLRHYRHHHHYHIRHGSYNRLHHHHHHHHHHRRHH